MIIASWNLEIAYSPLLFLFFCAIITIERLKDSVVSQVLSLKRLKTMGETAFLFSFFMKNNIIKINIIKLGLITSFGFFMLIASPISAWAKEIKTNEVLELINLSRAENNLPPLYLNPTLAKVADSKVKDMTNKHYFSHTSPEGVTPWHWFDKNNYFYKYAGENLAINYDDAQEEHDAWMKSPAHKKNILNTNFNEIGIATSKGIIEGKRSYVTVTVFGTPDENIFATSQKMPLASKNSYILGVQSNKNKNIINSKSDSLHSSIAKNKLFELIKEQSDNIIWTVALIAILIVLKDIIIKTISTRTFHHKHSAINLILFIMIYALLF